MSLAEDPATESQPKDLYRSIVDNGGFGILVTDITGNIVYANPRQCESTGYQLEELLGRNPRIFQSGRTPAPVYRELWATILAGRTWHGELVNRRKNGDLIFERVGITSITGTDGETTHFLAVTEEQWNHAPTKLMGGRRTAIDGLTGLPNRETLLGNLGETLSASHANGSGFALLYLDIDRFHTLNQTIGPIAADQLLLEIVSRISAAVRSNDLIARSGADEFVMVLNGTLDKNVCGDTAKRVLQRIAQPITIEEHTLEITGSIGIARYPLDAGSAEDLLRAAFLAQSAARHEGGDRFHFFAPEMEELANTQRDISSQLRHAVERDELRLHFQPQLSLASGQIVGVEALVRWQHAVQGLVPPGAFIPVAEETGMIIAISEWVLREACRRAKEWQDIRTPGIRIAVNLSARHFRYNNLPETVASVLAETGLEARLLELELTESAIMQDPGKAVRIVDRLKNLGVRISLDDFGTGYSSLAYLSRFAIDRLKIDQSFVRDITTNPVNASIATATIAMAHKLGKIVVAEGVETEAQMQFLRRHDCDEMQGYLFSRPVPAEDLQVILREGRHLRFVSDATAEAANTLLLVDDEQNVLNALRRLLRREGYRILTAGSGSEGLELLALQPVQVIVSDQRMPGMSGVEFLSKVKELYPETVRISLSGYSEISTVTDAINKGAIWKYITKPWDDESLAQEIRAAFRLVRERG
ncbi:MAG: EAL domain-containing protein [Rhodocyclales bacterium]|nr:EAL domain-containing protein [Rhodocyclales bacterium]